MSAYDPDGIENEYGQLDTVQYHLRQAMEAYENAQNGYQILKNRYGDEIAWLDNAITEADNRMAELEEILPKPEIYPPDAGRCEL